MNQFLLVGTYRTGSSAVGELLAVHPEIVCGWESTLRTSMAKKVGDASKILSGDLSVLEDDEKDFVNGIWTDETKAIGFRRLFRASNKWILNPALAPALCVDRFAGHMRWLQSKRNDIRIVHLVRRDNVAWLRSFGLSKLSGQYFGSEYPPGLSFTMALDEAEKRVRTKHYIDQVLSQLSRTNPYLLIEYEKFKGDNAGVSAQIVEFLGGDPAREKIQSPKAKVQSAKSGSQLFENQEDVAAMLDRKGIRYSQ